MPWQDTHMIVIYKPKYRITFDIENKTIFD